MGDDDALFQMTGTEKVDAIVAELWKTDGWPIDEVKDRAYVTKMIAAFPGLDLINEAHLWDIWMIDHDGKGKGVRHRARFANWCRNAIAFGRADRTNQSARPAQRRAGTRARTADEFGDTSERATRW